MAADGAGEHNLRAVRLLALQADDVARLETFNPELGAAGLEELRSIPCDDAMCDPIHVGTK